MAASSWCSARGRSRCCWSGCGGRRCSGSCSPPSTTSSAGRSRASYEARMSVANLSPAVAEITLAVAVCVILLVDAFAGARRARLTPTLTLLALAIGAALTVSYGQVGGRTLLFEDMYVADPLAVVLKLAAFLFVAV